MGTHMKIGAIEAGGTKFICGIGDETGNILEYTTFPTKTPVETLNHVIEFFHDKKFDALGVGAFGPVEVDPNSVKYGTITSTPKIEWQNYDLLAALKETIHVPIYLDTDVNVAALGEAKWGAANGLDSCVYITVGTGIGAGALVEGNLVHGLLHPEMGHMLVRKHIDDPFKGKCPYHQDCLEGLASGPAIQERWGAEGKNLADNHSVWNLEAYYLAQAIMNIVLTLSPKKIILGGGVMKQEQLFPSIHEEVVKLLNGYIDKKEVKESIADFIVPPLLKDFAGLKGAMALVLNSIQPI